MSSANLIVIIILLAGVLAAFAVGLGLGIFFLTRHLIRKKAK